MYGWDIKGFELPRKLQRRKTNVSFIPPAARGHFCNSAVSNLHSVAAPSPVWHSRSWDWPAVRERAQLLGLYSEHAGLRCKSALIAPRHGEATLIRLSRLSNTSVRKLGLLPDWPDCWSHLRPAY